MRSGACLVAMLLMGAPAWAQDADGITVDLSLGQLPPPQSMSPVPRAGQIAESAVGKAGMRHTRDQVDGINPMARINNRIQNRVQARVRNRIDRDYDSRANTTSPFEFADQATKRAGRDPR